MIMPLFPHYSLYPGGAFMMCESVEEFDPAVQQTATVSQVPDTVPKYESLDPLTQTMTVLSLIYQELIQPMCNQDYTEEYDVAELCTRFDEVSKQTTQVVNRLRCLLIKQMGMFGYLNHVGRSRYIYEPFFNMVGNFLTKRDALKKAGMSQYHCEYYSMPDFYDPYLFSTAIEMVNTGNLYLDGMLYLDQVKNVLMDYGSSRMIPDSTAIEFLTRMFESETSQEQLVYCDITLDDLFREYEYEMSTSAQRCPESVDRYSTLGLGKQFLCMASKVLRHTCQDSYNAYCDLTSNQMDRMVVADPIYSISDYHLKLKNLLYRCVNLFAIGVMVALCNACQLNEVKFRRDAVEFFTKNLLDWTTKR